jgi:methylmalonyl-CoA mutase cobalamin-binding subunit
MFGGINVDIQSWHHETIGRKVVDALTKNDFDAIYVSTMEEASDFIMKHVKPESTVGFGGSMTIKNMGIQDKVRDIGGKVLDHGESHSPEEMIATAKEEMFSDLYLCSSNAITLDGALVNVDMMGNRIAAMSFGPKKVIVVISIDKVCLNEAAAFDRLKTVAAPMNNKRLERPGLSNPCTKTGVCVNCQSKTRLCRLYSVMRRKPSMTDITVVIVGDSCGY